MKKLYFEIYDTTKDIKRWNSHLFFKLDISQDILGTITDFAAENKTDVKNLRLYQFETKAIWERLQIEWLKQVEWEG